MSNTRCRVYNPLRITHMLPLQTFRVRFTAVVSDGDGDGNGDGDGDGGGDGDGDGDIDSDGDGDGDDEDVILMA